MRDAAKTGLVFSGILATASAALHVLIPLGGPGWYAFFRAPTGLVKVARAGQPRAALTCLFITALLSLGAAYAFSGAGLLRRLPLLRTGLAVIGCAFLARGLGFVPLAIWNPRLFAAFCGRPGVDAFLLISSALCVLIGAGYLLGASRLGYR